MAAIYFLNVMRKVAGGLKNLLTATLDLPEKRWKFSLNYTATRPWHEYE